MVTYGSETTKVMDSRSVITIDGAIYGLAENWSPDEGYAEIVEHFPGTQTPVIGVGGFLGEIEVDGVYSTDLPTNLQTITSGDLSKHTVVITCADSQTPAATTKTHTLLNVRIFRQTGPQVRKQAMVRFRLRGLYAVPKVVT